MWIHQDNSISVDDNGRGIPVDKHPKEKIPTVEVVLTILHAGGKFGGEGYKVSGGLHGVGVSVVNALSSRVEVQVRKEGKEYFIGFDHGKTSEKLREVGPTKRGNGTTVSFWPDPEIFTETTVYDFDTLANRFREMAFLNKGLKIVLYDERVTDADGNPRTEVFQYAGGIVDFVKFLNEGKETLNKPIYFEAENDDGTVEVAMQWSTLYSNELRHGVCEQHQHARRRHAPRRLQAGRHAHHQRVRPLEGHPQGEGFEPLRRRHARGLRGHRVREAARPAVRGPDEDEAGQHRDPSAGAERRDPGPGRVPRGEPDPGQAHHRQGHPGAQGPRGRPQGARDDAPQRRAGLVRAAGQAGRLLVQDPGELRIFIVEGDSAGGSAKQARDRKTQAILPLRGKILNVERAGLHRSLSSDTISSLITAIGTNIGDDFDADQSRYHRIIIMTDADVDGAHIRILLLTFFYRYMPELINRGYIYIAQPPIFGLKKKNSRSPKIERYIYDESSLGSVLAEYDDPNKFDVQRYKGLGEMDPDQLWETTMEPATRTLLQVSIDDAAEAERVVSDLMGDQVEPRKEFIQKHARDVRFLDI